MKLLMCSCYMCKTRRKNNWNKHFIKHRKKSAKSKVRAMLKFLDWENLPTKVYIGYTD